MSYISIKNWSDDDKPREKLARWGAEKLSTSELIAILISTGSIGKSAIELAKELLQVADNDINQLARFQISDIKQVKGLGDAKAITIMAALELGKRRKATSSEKPIITSVEDAVSILRPLLMDKQQEHFYVMLLSRRNQIIKLTEISKGGISSVVVDPRIVLKEAITSHASGIILAHNHPSGSLQPSKADNQLTQKISEAAKLMEISLLDHIIIGGSGYYSYSENSNIL